MAARTKKKREATLIRADGVVLVKFLNRTTPSAPIKGCFAIFS